MIRIEMMKIFDKKLMVLKNKDKLKAVNEMKIFLNNNEIKDKKYRK